MTADALIQRTVRRPEATAMAGIVLLALSSIAGLAIADAAVVFRSGYLAVYFWLGITLGALLLLMLHGLTGGRWGDHARPWIVAAVAALPVLAVLFVPLWAGLDHLFPWAGDSRSQATFHANQQRWLQPAWQMARSAVYFAAWIGVAAAMGAWSGPRRNGVAPGAGAASAGMIATVIVITMFSIDWVLALSMEANSSMIGFTQVAGQGAGALAFVIVCAAVVPRDAPDRTGALQDLGNLLLAAVLFHAYTFYMDFLIVWQGNLPHEIAWWLQRGEGLAAIAGLGLVAFHMIVPFALLLSRAVKRSRLGLALAAASVLLGRLFHAWWDLAPAVSTESAWPVLLDVALVVAVGLLWLAAFTRFLPRGPASAAEAS